MSEPGKSGGTQEIGISNLGYVSLQIFGTMHITLHTLNVYAQDWPIQ